MTVISPLEDPLKALTKNFLCRVQNYQLSGHYFLLVRCLIVA